MKTKKSSFRKDHFIMIEKQMVAYSLAAAAILAGTKNSDAQTVIHTDVIPDAVLNTDGAEFDIVFGAQTKFKIRLNKSDWTTAIQTGSTYTITNTVTNVHPHTYHTPGTSITTTTTTTKQYYGYTKFYSQTYSVTSNRVGVLPQGTGNSFVRSGGYARAMNAGAIISAGNTFNNVGSNKNMATYYSHPYGGTSKGQFLGTTNKYLGLKFKIGSDTHYGWAQVQVAADASSATITGYAYEGTAGLGIIAGETDISLAVGISELSAVQGIEGVRLFWTMEITQDLLGFIVERQIINDKEEGISEWEKIASYETHPELQASDNQSSRQTYIFKDKSAIFDMRYQYRLSEVDLSGRTISQRIVQAETISVPTEFTLQQNYPNPFNPSTRIQFGLPEKSRVKLTIYNMRGQVIDVLLDKTMEAGYHTIKYDASLLSSGVYIYELKRDTERLVKKMQVIK
jgi:hypothetical protein